MEWRNQIQFEADKFGIRLAHSRCWSELKPANLLINDLIAQKVKFSDEVAAAIQTSFDRAIEAVQRLSEEKVEKGNVEGRPSDTEA